MKQLPKTIKDSYTSSQSWIQIRNISVKRTSGGRRYYQKIVKDLERSEPEHNLTGKNIMDLVRNFKYSLNKKGQIITKEKS